MKFCGLPQPGKTASRDNLLDLTSLTGIQVGSYDR